MGAVKKAHMAATMDDMGGQEHIPHSLRDYRNSDIAVFADEVLGIKLTQQQLNLMAVTVDALAEGKELVIYSGRTAGRTAMKKVFGEYLKHKAFHAVK